MFKDWKIVVCTRHRALLFASFWILLIGFSSVVLTLISKYTIEHQIREYGQKIGMLKLGMEENELIRIMGNPESKETVRPAYWQGIPEEIKNHERILAYSYSLISFYSTSGLRSHTVFLDESSKRILCVMPSTNMVDFVPIFGTGQLFILSVGIYAVLSHLCVRWWCRKKELPGP